MENTRKEIRTEIFINATPEKVWSILVDFDRYREWNPFIKWVKGEAVTGSRITARIEPPGASGMTFKPKLILIKKNEELRWLGHLFFKGLFDGEHIFELHQNNDGTTTFVQREQFKGVLLPLFSEMLDINSVLGFEMMNKRLKERAESD